MREIVIVIADLYLPLGADDAPIAAGASWGPVPGIEYAGRFGERAALTQGWREWLAHSLGREDLAGVAPACIAAAAADVVPHGPSPAAANMAGATGTTWIATPLQLTAGASRLHLDQRGILRLPRAQLTQLAAAFHDTFASSGFTLTPLSCGEFLLETPGIAPVSTTEPARCAGGDVAQALPQGPGAAPLRRLLAEIEMWLHGQALNEARVRRGEPPVTTLWPWGATGRAVRPERRAARATLLAFGSDAYLSGLWHLQGSVCRALPERLEDVLTDAHASFAVLVVQCTPGESLGHLDARFVSPALQALRRGEVAKVTLIANDMRVTLRRRSHLRLWRRARAGLESFA
ncbi:MAG TPA: hypothetical protein VGD47_09955 [Steroidobacteraceae bacterium]